MSTYKMDNNNRTVFAAGVSAVLALVFFAATIVAAWLNKGQFVAAGTVATVMLFWMAAGMWDQRDRE